MSIMAKHSQIIWAQPTDADVAARNKAVAKLRTLLCQLSTRGAIKAAGAIADSFREKALPEPLAAEVQTAISNESPAFVLTGNELQGTVCLAVAALALVEQQVVGRSAWSSVDALAAALWSALTFQDQIDNAKVEELRQKLIAACRARVAAVARDSRSRHEVPDVGTLTIPEADTAGTRANNAYRKATAPVIAALKNNQELDREEIDFLWWVITDYSAVLDCPLAAKDPPTRAIAAGLEGARMLRRLPGDGFRHAVLRLVGPTEAIPLPVLVTALGEDRARLAVGPDQSLPSNHPTVFPLLAALATTGDVDGSTPALDARGWGARALLEASIIAMEARFGGEE